jgi:hypothetical protein
VQLRLWRKSSALLPFAFLLLPSVEAHRQVLRHKRFHPSSFIPPVVAQETQPVRNLAGG